jgi:hypothetical protein
LYQPIKKQAMYIAASRVKSMSSIMNDPMLCRIVRRSLSITFFHVSFSQSKNNAIHKQFFSTEKHNIMDERQALTDTLQVLEDHLRNGGGNNENRLFLSSSSSSSRPGLGDLAVFGTLRALEGLPLHTAILAGGTTAKTTGDETPTPTVLGSWYERMQRLTPSAAVLRH